MKKTMTQRRVLWARRLVHHSFAFKGYLTETYLGEGGMGKGDDWVEKGVEDGWVEMGDRWVGRGYG